MTDPRKAYRQSAIHTESTADIFIAAYDQLASLLHSAALAVSARDIEKKTRDLDRALTILVHLQGALDFERGGQVAHTLNRFYVLIRREIFKASCRLDAQGLRQAAAHVTDVRKIWEQAQALTLRNESPQVFPAPPSAPAGKPSRSGSPSLFAAEPAPPSGQSGDWTA